ncbi:MAG: hypothetical protein ACOCN3_13390, partial [Roseburia inulinivorans]
MRELLGFGNALSAMYRKNKDKFKKLEKAWMRPCLFSFFVTMTGRYFDIEIAFFVCQKTPRLSGVSSSFSGVIMKDLRVTI